MMPFIALSKFYLVLFKYNTVLNIRSNPPLFFIDQINFNKQIKRNGIRQERKTRKTRFLLLCILKFILCYALALSRFTCYATPNNSVNI